MGTYQKLCTGEIAIVIRSCCTKHKLAQSEGGTEAAPQADAAPEAKPTASTAAAADRGSG